MENQKPKWFSMFGKLKSGVFVTLKIEVIDEYATVRTSNAQLTKDLANSAAPGEEAKYIERMQKTICKYPGKKQEEIIELLKYRINKHFPGLKEKK